MISSDISSIPFKRNRTGLIAAAASPVIFSWLTLPSLAYVSTKSKLSITFSDTPVLSYNVTIKFRQPCAKAANSGLHILCSLST